MLQGIGNLIGKASETIDFHSKIKQYQEHPLVEHCSLIHTYGGGLLCSMG
jgi:hypothetical protein